jgi:FPC/CPF motif-containing protein YcgG
MLLEPRVRLLSLHDLIMTAPQCSADTSFGADIDGVHKILLTPGSNIDAKVESFLSWLSRYQPCLFGRLACRDLKNLSLDVCWITAEEIARGDQYLIAKIQASRRAWKDRGVKGNTHGFLVVLNSQRLAYASPSEELLEICKRVGDIYLPEFAPIEVDTIYTEALPLKGLDGKFRLFKAGINIFYTSSHGTLNHDRRVPGGLVISANSVGHYAQSLVVRGIVKSIDDALRETKELALGSIGNGGIGGNNVPSTTWHPSAGTLRPTELCPEVSRASARRFALESTYYSGFYHTDVLVPKAVTLDSRPISKVTYPEVWPSLSLEYMTKRDLPRSHPDYGQFQGLQINEEDRYYNPWLPVPAVNSGHPGELVTEFPTNPFDTPAARVNSSYLGRHHGMVVDVRTLEVPPPLANEVHDHLCAWIKSEEFPCIGAKYAIARGFYRFGLYRKMTSAHATAGLAYDLFQFIHEQPILHPVFTTYMASFYEPAECSEAEFEQLLWTQLQRLHEEDGKYYEWDKSVSSNPRDPNFAFSFAGRAFFVVGLNRAAHRLSRRFRWPTLVFNAHYQFQRLRELGHFDRLKREIRDRDNRLQGPNPYLSDFGDESEAAQYAGRAVAPDWKCPFSTTPQNVTKKRGENG